MAQDMKKEFIEAVSKAVKNAMVTEEKSGVKNVSIKYEGTEIILPSINGKPMSFPEAISWLERKQEEDEQEVAVHHQFSCSPLDGAVAFHKALSRIFGWTHMVPTPGFFGSRPPTMVGVAVSPTETIQVGIGRIQIPGIEGYLSANIVTEPKPQFIIGGAIKKKYSKQVDEIVAETKRFLKEDSIYKGSAVKIGFRYLEEGEDFDPIEDAPKFLELNGVEDNDLIFGEEVDKSLNVGLFTPIEHSQSCREVGVPLKRGVLLYGPYGTGKTMTAYVTAKKAVRNGWTFVYLDNVEYLKEALDFCSHYAPCVLFSEDIDRVMNGERSVDMDEILNTLDGVDTKGSEIITVFTTNHIEDINPATLRMGRLDTLVHVAPPDATAVERLVRLYSRGLLDATADLKNIGKALAGQIPAFIREVTERAKIAAISRVGSSDIKGKVLEEDLLSAATAMEPHAALLRPKKKDFNFSQFQVLVPANQLQESVQETVNGR